MGNRGVLVSAAVPALDTFIAITAISLSRLGTCNCTHAPVLAGAIAHWCIALCVVRTSTHQAPRAPYWPSYLAVSRCSPLQTTPVLAIVMTLTAKQAARVNKAPQAQKDALRSLYKRQNANSARPKPPPPRQTKKRTGALAVPRSIGYAFDGFDKRHLPIDELTAPYATTNFVTVMEFGSSAIIDQVIVVCPRKHNTQEVYAGPLTDYIAMRYDAAERIVGSIPTLDAARCPIIDMPEPGTGDTFTSVRARLHNQSIRLSCLGTNTGLYPPGGAYVGTVPMIEVGGQSTGYAESLTIKQAWADDSIAVGYLKSVSAAKLQDRPFVLHSAVAEAMSYKSWNDMSVPASTTNRGSMSFSTALEPIVLYIPRAGAGNTVVNYRLEIGQQWCSRHPHNIMLRATQKQHPATAPSLWHAAVGAVKDVGEQLMNHAGGAAMEALANRARTYLALPQVVD